jgi:hypothetical protein
MTSIEVDDYIQSLSVVRNASFLGSFFFDLQYSVHTTVLNFCSQLVANIKPSSEVK